MTHAIELFLAAERATALGIPMVPRSANDKEYFPQDWFADRLRDLDVPFKLQGRNAYPDFVVGSEGGAPPVEGYEVKSLGFSRGRAARKDYDSNSSLPSGRKADRNIFLVFFLYTGSGLEPRVIHSLTIAHLDLINCDHALADSHLNIGVGDFGSYADGFIRNRKMYRFPHPFSIAPEVIGRRTLILPGAWEVEDRRLHRLDRLERRVAPQSVVRYTIDLLQQGKPDVEKLANPQGGAIHAFDVFEAAPAQEGSES